MKEVELNTSQDMLDYILKINGFNSTPYFEDSLVKIGYGHKVPKTWLVKNKTVTQEEAFNFFLKDLKKIESNPLIQELKDDQVLFDICVHFIYDHGIQPFKNCKLDILARDRKYNEIILVLDAAIEHFSHCKLKDKRLHDIKLLLSKSGINGNKKRIFKKNVGFSG